LLEEIKVGEESSEDSLRSEARSAVYEWNGKYEARIMIRSQHKPTWRTACQLKLRRYYHRGQATNTSPCAYLSDLRGNLLSLFDLAFHVRPKLFCVNVSEKIRLILTATAACAVCDMSGP